MSELMWTTARLIKGKPFLKDNRPLPAVGKWHENKPNIAKKEIRLLVYPTPLDALRFAGYGIVYKYAMCLVEVDGITRKRKNSSKYSPYSSMCRRFRIIDWCPIEPFLWPFSFDCVANTLSIWDMDFSGAHNWIKTYVFEEGTHSKKYAKISCLGQPKILPIRNEAEQYAFHAVNAVCCCTQKEWNSNLALWVAEWTAAAFSLSCPGSQRWKAEFNRLNNVLESMLLGEIKL